MVASYTPNGRITLQGTDDNPNTWGTVMNNQVITLLERMIIGVRNVDLTGSSDVTLSTVNGADDEARNAVLELTGTIGADINLILPAAEKPYFIRADYTGDHTVTLTVTGASTSVPVVNGDVKVVYTNGAEIYDLVNLDLSPYMEKANNLSDLTDVSAARDELELGDLATKTIGTGFEESPAGTLNVPVAETSLVGEVKIWPAPTAPSKYLLCQGQLLDRTTYADLFAVYGEIHGAGDGSTTFQLPDYRGEFLRGHDDGKGSDPTVGRELGTYQLDAFQNFVGFFGSDIAVDQVLFYTSGSSGGQQGDFTTTRRNNFDPSRVPGTRTSTETRPRNASVNYIVYTGVA